MSISSDSRTLGIGEIESKCTSETSVNAENTASTSEAYDTEEMNSTNDRILPELIIEMIGANLEPLNEQNSTLNQLIQDNSAKTTQTPGSHTHRLRMETPLNRKISASRTSPEKAWSVGRGLESNALHKMKINHKSYFFDGQNFSQNSGVLL